MPAHNAIVADSVVKWRKKAARSKAETPTVNFDDVIAPFLQQELGIDVHFEGTTQLDYGVVIAAYTQAALLQAANSAQKTSTMKIISYGFMDFRQAVMKKIEAEQGLEGDDLLIKAIRVETRFKQALKEGLGMGQYIAA